jgi:hypothetical protein
MKLCHFLTPLTIFTWAQFAWGQNDPGDPDTQINNTDRSLIGSADAEPSVKSQSGKITPESTTLPLDVARFRLLYLGSEGTYGYDSKGKKVERGLKVNGSGGAAVFEYGLTPKIGLQLLIPFALKTNIKVDNKQKFREYVKSEITETVDSSFEKILADPTIGSLYKSSGVAPANIGIPDVGVIPAGANVKTFLDAAKAQALANALSDSSVDNEVIKAKSSVEGTDFDKGLGDIETGAKYTLSTLEDPFFSGIPLYFSVAGGVRFNSSGYAKAVKSGMVPAGRGTTDFGLRLNAEFGIIQGLQAQVENQTEVMILKGKTYDESTSKEVDYERSGLRQIGWAKLVIAPGAWVPSADMLRLNYKYGYDKDAKVKEDGKLQTQDAPQSCSQTIGLSFDGLTMGIPFQMDLDMTTPLSGKNVGFATKSNLFTLKTFYKF